jgi:predicted Zn-dependent protease with MMP-like domain
MKEPGQQRRWIRLCAAAQDEVTALLRALPGPLRERARALPVTFEPHPSPDLVADGLEPDLLGLFNGEAFPDGVTGGDALPAHITLYLENLWDYARRDAEIFREEVRRTYLHELGHYLGLDEDALADRDLD